MCLYSDSKIIESIGSGQGYQSCFQTQMTTWWHLRMLSVKVSILFYFCMTLYFLSPLCLRRKKMNLVTDKLGRLQVQSN